MRLNAIAEQATVLTDLLDLSRGYALVDSPASDLGEVRSFLDGLLAFGYVHISVFQQSPEWKPIGVNPDIEDYRVGGTGFIPLHIDFVNATCPPDVVAFYCCRADRMGGGESVLCPISAIMRHLGPSRIPELSGMFVFEGRFFSLSNVGEKANPFPLWDGEFFRFTGKKLRAEADDFEGASLFREIEAVAMQNSTSIAVKAGQILIVNQRLSLHGRQALVRDPNGEVDEGRLLYQRFYRIKE